MQFVTFRVEAVGLVRKATLTEHAFAGEDASQALCGHREVWLAEAGAFVPAALRPQPSGGGQPVRRPRRHRTDGYETVVLPGMTACVDPIST